jgi:hypothetical protein
MVVTAKPRIPRLERKYFETGNYDEVNEMIRSGQWELHEVQLGAKDHRSSKTIVLVSRQAA